VFAQLIEGTNPTSSRQPILRRTFQNRARRDGLRNNDVNVREAACTHVATLDLLERLRWPSANNRQMSHHRLKSYGAPVRLILSNIGVGRAKTTEALPAIPALPGITTLTIEDGSIRRAVTANESISKRLNEVFP
jgi:hypothetical protein